MADAFKTAARYRGFWEDRCSFKRECRRIARRTYRVHDLAEDWPSCQYERQDAVGIDYHPSAKPPPKPRPLRPSEVQI